MDSVGETGWGFTPQGGAAHNSCYATLKGGSHLTKIVCSIPKDLPHVFKKPKLIGSHTLFGMRYLDNNE